MINDRPFFTMPPVPPSPLISAGDTIIQNGSNSAVSSAARIYIYICIYIIYIYIKDYFSFVTTK